MKADYARLVELANEGSRNTRVRRYGVLWRSWYDLTPQAFAAKTDALWTQSSRYMPGWSATCAPSSPRRYGPAIQPPRDPSAPTCSATCGAILGQHLRLVAPPHTSLGYDLTQALQAAGYDAVKIVHTADDWYQSIGFAPEPATFWERSMITRPRDREVVCHASAWDVDAAQICALKACLTVTADDFYTAHHELGTTCTSRAYAGQPYLFRDGAN